MAIFIPKTYFDDFETPLSAKNDKINIDRSPYIKDNRFEEPLRPYDEAIMTWLNNIYVRPSQQNKPKKVTVVRSGGEKAYMYKTIKNGREEWVNALVLLKNNRTAVPIIGFRDIGWEYDKTRYLPHANLDVNYDFSSAMKMGYTDETKEKIIMRFRDVPITINYTFDIWCRYQSERNQIFGWFSRQINPNKQFQIKGSYSFLTTPTWRDSSDYEPGEKSRLVRFGFESTFMDCWINVGSYEVPTVTSVRNDYVDKLLPDTIKQGIVDDNPDYDDYVEKTVITP